MPFFKLLLSAPTAAAEELGRKEGESDFHSRTLKDNRNN